MPDEFKEALEQIQASVANVLQLISQSTGANPNGDVTEPAQEMETKEVGNQISEQPVETRENTQTNDDAVETVEEIEQTEETPKQTDSSTSDTVSQDNKDESLEPTEEEIDDAARMLSV